MVEAPATVLLASLARGGDPAALNELLAELRPLVVRTARLVVGSGSWAAEDAAQEALLDISRGIGRLRDPAAVRAWALQVAIRRALRVARRERLLRFRNVPVLERLQESAPGEGREAALKEAFDSLPPRLRATAVLRLLAGLSEDETADALGCSVGAVKSNLHDARKRLTRLLSEAGYAPTVKQRKESSDDQ
jgi:RNA polymerase sigma-70 factor (ECF subfamily)